MIIIVVLGVLAILMTLVTNLAGEATYASQMMATIRAQDRSYYVAQSAVRAVLPLLPSSSESAHTLQDPWAIGAPPLEIDGNLVEVKITDEERFYNPNAMIGKDGQVDDDQVKVFRRLVKQLGQRDDEVVNPILDWIDADSNRRLPGGAEALDYGERLPKNAPLDSIDEILQVKGIPPTLLRGSGASPSPGAGRAFQSGGIEKYGLSPLITVHSNGKVNINTAPPAVLQALAENLDSGLVKAIIDHRERTPFKKLDDLLEVPGVTRDHIYFLKKVADVKSETWQIKAEVGAATGSYTLEGPPDTTLIARYRGSGRGIKPLTWNLEESGSDVTDPTSDRSASPRGASPTPSPSMPGRSSTPAQPTGNQSTQRF